MLGDYVEGDSNTGHYLFEGVYSFLLFCRNPIVNPKSILFSFNDLSIASLFSVVISLLFSD